VIVAAGTVIVVARLASDHHSVRSPVSGSRGGSVGLGGARLSVPPGAVTGRGHLVASTGNSPPSAGELRTGLVLAGGAKPVHFQVGGARVSGPLEITFRIGAVGLPGAVPAPGRATAVWLAYYDTAARRWQPVASRYDPATGTVTAQVRHLSWWAPWTWDWAGFALRLRQALSAFGSGRAAASSCPGIPKVTVTSAGGQDPPLIGCAASRSQGTFTVSITNNRGVSVVMSGVPPGATQDRASYRGFDEYIATREAVSHVLGGTDLPPSETLTYSLPLHGPPAMFTAEPTVPSYVLDLATAAGQALLDHAEFAKVSGAYATCVLDAVARDATASFADAPHLAVQCMPSLAEAVPALRGLKSPVLELLLKDAQFLLQDFDLAHDAWRGVRGAVSITGAFSPELIDWRNTTYTTTCVTGKPVSVTVRNGKGHYVISDQPYTYYFDLQVEGATRLGGTSSPTAVLLQCTPHPANFFSTVIHLVSPAGQQFGPELSAPNLLHAYQPYFDGHPFAYSNGTLQTGAQYYTSCHACGTVPYLLTWKWTGSQLKLLTATRQ
jgi:hypothetical protein